MTVAVSSPRTIRVLLVDDHGIVRKGLRALLATEAGIEVVGEAEDGKAAVLQAQVLKPDVIMMDLVMPVMDGVEAIRQVTALVPGVRILVLTSFAADDKVFPAIEAGALGYILKDADPEDIARAVRMIDRGEPFLHPTIARKVLKGLARSTRRTLQPEPLTARETQVLRLLALGLSNQEIAARMVLTKATVRTHVGNVLKKLHLQSRTQAALHAVREGLIPPDSDEEPS